MNKLLIDTDVSMLESGVNDPDCAIILPDIIQTRNFYEHLLESGVKSIELSNIYTVDSFIAMILHLDTLPVMPRFLERVITKDIILRLSDLNKDYAELVNYPEFVSLFIDEFNTMQDNQNIDNTDDGRLEYFKKFSSMYNNIIDTMHFQSHITLENSASRIIKVDGCRYKKIYFANFFMIDNVFLNLIESLLSRADVTMFYYDSDSIMLVNERLRHLNPELHRKKHDYSENMQFLAVPDQRSEIITIARKIAELSKQVRFSEIMIAFRDAKLYEPLIREIFSMYHIPYFIETRQRFQDLEIYASYRSISSRLVYNAKDAGQFLTMLIEHLESLKIDKDEYRDSLRFINYLRQFYDYIPYLNLDDRNKIQVASLLDLYISTYTYGKMPANKNVVKVVDIGNMFFNSPRFLFIGNMKEGVFPRIMESKDLIDPQIKAQYGFYYRTSYMDMKNEDYYFDMLLQSSENIIFTYSYRDQKAKREYQSRYLRRLEADHKIKKEEYDPLKYPDHTVFYTRRELLRALISNRNMIIEDMNVQKELDHIISVPLLHDIEERKSEIATSLQSRDFTPSELTMFKKCGLSYFYRYVLQISKPEEPFGSTATGTLYHNILKDFYTDHRDFKEDLDLRNEIKRYVSRHLKSFKEQVDSKVLEIIELSVTKKLLNFLSFDRAVSRNRVVKEVEYPFSWQLYDNTVIRGRIDRIDYSGSGHVIIDYKYTSPDNLKKLYKEDLAMPIYLTYMSAKISAMMGKYYSLKLTSARYSPVIESNYTKTLYVGMGEGKINPDHLKEELLEIIDKIRKASFAAMPGEECRHCDYYDLCAYYLGGGSDGAE
ncbi:MAG: PD-(D/E)XK nuclease family protein [Thermoplasmata archaeon]